VNEAKLLIFFGWEGKDAAIKKKDAAIKKKDAASGNGAATSRDHAPVP
jgi:hypothetical protein